MRRAGRRRLPSDPKPQGVYGAVFTESQFTFGVAATAASVAGDCNLDHAGLHNRARPVLLGITKQHAQDGRREGSPPADFPLSLNQWPEAHSLYLI
jgi:hypothetical protein